MVSNFWNKFLLCYFNMNFFCAAQCLQKPTHNNLLCDWNGLMCPPLIGCIENATPFSEEGFRNDFWYLKINFIGASKNSCL